MDFSEELRRYRLKTEHSYTDEVGGTVTQSMDLKEAAAFLEQNPEHFQQIIFNDNTVTSISLTPEYRVSKVANTPLPAGAEKYDILTAYHKEMDNVDGDKPYNAVIARGSFSHPTGSDMAFRSLDLQGYSIDPSLQVTVTAPQDFRITSREGGYGLNHTSHIAMTPNTLPAEGLSIYPLSIDSPVKAAIEFILPQDGTPPTVLMGGSPVDFSTAAACAKWVTQDVKIDDVTELPSGSVSCPWIATPLTTQHLK